MEILKYALICLLTITELVFLVLAIKSRKPLTVIFGNALLGIGAIIIINLTAKYSGCYIPVNLYSVSGAALLGLPAVAGLLIMNFLFI